MECVRRAIAITWREQSIINETKTKQGDKTQNFLDSKPISEDIKW